MLYGSIALAFWDFAAVKRLWNLGGAGIVVWVAILGAASYGVFWVWRQAREYG